MPAPQDIRTTLSRGFSVDNLRTITNLALKTLQQGNPKHPAIFHALASVSRWVADAWDNLPITVKVADRVEAQLKPCLEALIEVADGTSTEVCGALDDLAIAFRDSVRRGLDRDLSATSN